MTPDMTSSWEPYYYRCSAPDCGRSMDERKEVVWTAVRGWEKKRSQGGTNHIALRRPLNQFMCNECMLKEISGLSAGQQAMPL